MLTRFSGVLAAVFLATSVQAQTPAPAASGSPSAAELARKAQNPVADMISVPFQLNWNFNTGPLDKGQQILNIQPVIPFTLNDDWNLITRTILPVISQPAFSSGQSRENGIGDINLTAFFSPKKPTESGWIWGAGPAVIMDTASDDRLGQGAWSVGPSAVFLKMPGDWVVGGLVSQVWSVSEDEGRPDVNQMLIQPFINYNFPKHPGRYLTFSPVITANWEASSSNTWTVPLGLGIGQIVKPGKVPLNLQIGAFYNVIRPDDASNWQIRAQAVMLFPK